jgi:integrase
VLAAGLEQLAAAPLDALTLAAWGERWLETRDVRPGTASRDAARWRLYVTKRPLGSLRLAEVTEAHVEAWLTSTRHLAAQTRQNALGLIKQALAAATKTGGPLAGKVNPAGAVKLGRRARERKAEAWTWLRLEQIDAALAIDTVPLRSRIFWTCAIYSGLRPGELCGLRWDGVDFDRGIIHVRFSRSEAPKNGRPREVPMLSPVRDALLRWRDLYELTGVRSHLGLVFPARDGGYHADGYDAGWYEAVKGTPLAVASIYDFRHTCASHLLQGSWAPELLERALRIEEVSQWLGHSDITVTQRYAHLCPDAIAGLVAGHSRDTGTKPPPRFELGTYGLRRPKRASGSSSETEISDDVSRLVSRLEVAAVRAAEAIERGDRHRDHRALDVVVLVAELAEALRERGGRSGPVTTVEQRAARAAEGGEG